MRLEDGPSLHFMIRSSGPKDTFETVGVDDGQVIDSNNHLLQIQEVLLFQR